jgi:hypothetical protein
MSCASLVGVAMLMATATVQAADKVDCSRLSLEFEPIAQADWSECYRLHHGGPASGTGAESRSADYEIILADLKTHVVHLVSGDSGPNTYFEKQPVSHAIKDFDELEDIADTQSEEKFQRYQIIRFQASLWKTPVHCVGFVKYGGGAITQGGLGLGAGTFLEGYDCWRDRPPNRSQIEATLSAIDD